MHRVMAHRTRRKHIKRAHKQERATSAKADHEKAQAPRVAKGRVSRVRHEVSHALDSVRSKAREVADAPKRALRRASRLARSLLGKRASGDRA